MRVTLGMLELIEYHRIDGDLTIESRSVVS